MTFQDILRIHDIHEYPAITVLLPIAHKSENDRRQIPVRLNNLWGEVEQRLLTEFSRREIEPLKKKWNVLLQEINYQSPSDGLALFISPSYAQIVELSHSPTERVTVDENFSIRDLVYELSRSLQFSVLTLSREVARFYEATSGSLVETVDGIFPVTRHIPGVEVEWTGSMPPGSPHGGIDPDQYQTREDREFLQRVDNALDRVMLPSAPPLAIVGVKKNIGLFKTVSRHKDQVIVELQGNYEKLPLHELNQRIRPLVKTALTERQARLLYRLDDSIGFNRYSGGLQEVWSAAQEGRIDSLLLEEDFDCPGWADGNELTVIANNYRNTPGIRDDIVNDIVGQVLDTGGQVFFFDSGTLDRHDHIAAILRY